MEMGESQMEPVDPADQRLRGAAASGISAELRATLALATPLAAANLAQMAMAVTNTVMVGRLGAMPLAAAGLGGMSFFQHRRHAPGHPFRRGAARRARARLR